MMRSRQIGVATNFIERWYEKSSFCVHVGRYEAFGNHPEISSYDMNIHTNDSGGGAAPALWCGEADVRYARKDCSCERPVYTKHASR